MFIRYEIQTNRVVYEDKEKPINVENGVYAVAEVDNIPTYNKRTQYLTITNLREATRIVKEAYTETIEFDEEGNLLEEPQTIEHKELIETYITCDLIVNDRQKTPLTEKQKERQYNSYATKLIRQKYDADAVEALFANIIAKPNNEEYKKEFADFTAYRIECKTKAKAKYNLK